MTMIGELMVLHKRFGRLEQFSVALMLSGAVVAARLVTLTFVHHVISSTVEARLIYCHCVI